MRLIVLLLTAISLGGCIHIDVHKTEEISNTTQSTEEHIEQDN